MGRGFLIDVPLNPRDPLSFLIAASIWVLFGGLVLNSYIIAGMSFVYACLYAATLLLYLAYRK